MTEEERAARLNELLCSHEGRDEMCAALVSMEEQAESDDRRYMRLLTQYRRVCAENDCLRDLVRGFQTCTDDEADARDCPMYDEGEPYRCKRDRIIGELGLENA